MRPDLSVSHHMAGTANPLYTSKTSTRFFWTKTASGFPWDIQLFDSKYIYLWVTELDWQNPRATRHFAAPDSESLTCRLSPGTPLLDTPDQASRSATSSYEIHSDCKTFVTKNLGHVINEVWGPYKESLGGQLPNNLQTLVISYRYSCDSNYSNCKDKEEFHVAKPYGLVKWQHQSLNTSGTYNPPDNSTSFNKMVSGQTIPVTSCF